MGYGYDIKLAPDWYKNDWEKSKKKYRYLTNILKIYFRYIWTTGCGLSRLAGLYC